MFERPHVQQRQPSLGLKQILVAVVVRVAGIAFVLFQASLLLLLQRPPVLSGACVSVARFASFDHCYYVGMAAAEEMCLAHFADLLLAVYPLLRCQLLKPWSKPPS